VIGMSETSDDTMIADVINNYLTKEVVTNPELLPIKGDTMLIRSGVLDSLSLLKLVFFLEKQFSITVDMEEVIPENFETIDTICGLIKKKKNSGTPATGE
jgi:acyl carrier protein